MKGYKSKTLDYYLQKALDTPEYRRESSFLDSGFSNIEEELNGLQLGEFYVLGGAPAMGTQLFASQLALQVSKNTGVLYLPQKETPERLIKYLLGIAGDIQFYKLEQQSYDDEVIAQVRAAMASLKSRKFFIEGFKRFEKQEFFTLVEDYITQNDVRLVIIDDEKHFFKNLKGFLSADEKYDFLLDLKVLFHRLNCCGILLKKIKPAPQTLDNFYRLPKVKSLQAAYDLAALADHIWLFHRLSYYGIRRDAADRDTQKRIDLYDMSEDGGYLRNLYFEFNRRSTGMEVRRMGI